MPQRYDAHCHLFDKGILQERLFDILYPVFGLLEIGNVVARRQQMKRILQRLIRTLKIINVNDNKKVFEKLDEAYDHELVVTPLMFDLTYADDDDGRGFSETSYRLRQRFVLRLIRMLRTMAIPMMVMDDEIQELLAEEIDGRPVLDFIEYELRNTRMDREVFDDRNYKQQIIQLETLSSHEEYGARVMPFFGIDPRRFRSRPDLINEVKKRVKGDAPLWNGVKLYAPSGFSPTDPKLFGPVSNRLGLYRYCEDEQIPITVHCSSSGFSTIADNVKFSGHLNTDLGIKLYRNKVYHFKKPFFGKFGAAIKERATVINHPKIWKLVFERYPNLRLNLAHLGGDSQILNYAYRNLPTQAISDRLMKQLLSRCDAEQHRVVESSYRKSGKWWNIEFTHYYSHDESAETYERRSRLWDVFYQIGYIDNWSRGILDIILDPAYPNAYTDLSCFTETNSNGEDRINEHLADFKRLVYDKLPPEGQRKVLYGSDFWLNVMQGPEMKQYYEDFKSVFGADFDAISIHHPTTFLNMQA